MRSNVLISPTIWYRKIPEHLIPPEMNHPSPYIPSPLPTCAAVLPNKVRVLTLVHKTDIHIVVTIYVPLDINI
jgi:hypothetical protein